MAEQPPPEEERRRLILAVLTGVAAAGATSAAAGAAVAPVALSAALLGRLAKLLLSWRYDRRVVRYVIRSTTEVVSLHAWLSITGSTTPGPARPPRVAVTQSFGDAVRAELAYASWFLERTGARVQAAVDAAGTDPAARKEALDKAIENESRFQEQHVKAQKARAEAARRVAEEAAKPGAYTVQPVDPADGDQPNGEGLKPRVVLAWVAHQDDRVTPECAAADGCWFYADTPPVIGFPGMPHGGTCRCTPGKATARMFLHGRSVDDAVRPLLDKGAVAHPGSTVNRPRRTDVA